MDEVRRDMLQVRTIQGYQMTPIEELVHVARAILAESEAWGDMTYDQSRKPAFLRKALKRYDEQEENIITELVE